MTAKALYLNGAHAEFTKFYSPAKRTLHWRRAARRGG
jgi:hypothetical protein